MSCRVNPAIAILAMLVGVLACSVGGSPTPTAEGTSPPIVTGIWPPNSTSLSENAEWSASWDSRPRLEITFDRQMNEENLQTPQSWLRVWQVLNYGDNEIVVKLANLSYMGVTDTPLTGAEGVTVVYNMTTPPLDPRPNESPRYLVQMRGDSVADTGAPPLSLDADFSGTELSATALDHIWNLPGEEWFGNEIWDGLVDTGARLPSGDDSEGGLFHGWFEV